MKMELKIIDSNKNRLKFEIKGTKHTLCNILSKELWNDKNVSYAGYNLEHPLVSHPKIVVETERGSPQKVLKDAVERLKAKNKDFLSEIKKIK